MPRDARTGGKENERQRKEGRWWESAEAAAVPLTPGTGEGAMMQDYPKWR